MTESKRANFGTKLQQLRVALVEEGGPDVPVDDLDVTFAKAWEIMTGTAVFDPGLTTIVGWTFILDANPLSPCSLKIPDRRPSKHTGRRAMVRRTEWSTRLPDIVGEFFSDDLTDGGAYWVDAYTRRHLPQP